MRKIIISLILIGLLVLAGCSGKSETAEPETTPPVSETPVETPSQDVTPPQEPETESESDSQVETKPADLPDGPTALGEKSKTYKWYSKLFGAKEFTMVQRMQFSIGDAESSTVSVTAYRDGVYASKSTFSGGGETNEVRLLLEDKKVTTIYDSMKMYTVSDISEEMDTSFNMEEMLGEISEAEFVSGTAEIDGEKYDTETFVNQGISMTYFFQGDDLKFFEAGTEAAATRVYIDEATLGVDPALFEIPDDYEESQGVG